MTPTFCRTPLFAACSLVSAIAALPVGSVHAAGFVEDAKVTLGLRNYYFNRNYLNGTDP